jgi:hypothetical protein
MPVAAGGHWSVRRRIMPFVESGHRRIVPLVESGHRREREEQEQPGFSSILRCPSPGASPSFIGFHMYCQPMNTRPMSHDVQAHISKGTSCDNSPGSVGPKIAPSSASPTLTATDARAGTSPALPLLTAGGDPETCFAVLMLCYRHRRAEQPRGVREKLLDAGNLATNASLVSRTIY